MIPNKVIKYHSLKFKAPFARTQQLFALLELFLKDVISKERNVPSKEVDEVWHTFILHTKLYEEYCKKEFGTFIHHNPHLPAKKVNCNGEGDQEEEEDGDCDSAFASLQLNNPCDGVGGNDDGGNNDNDCDAQYTPKTKQVEIEYIE